MIIYILISVYLMVNCFLAGKDFEASEKKQFDYFYVILVILFGLLFNLVYLGWGFLLFLREFGYDLLSRSKWGFKMMIHIFGFMRNPEKINWDTIKHRENEILQKTDQTKKDKHVLWGLNYIKEVHKYNMD